MKIIIIPDKLEDLNLSDHYDAIIVGLEGFAVHSGINLNLEEIKKLINSTSKEVFISINKNIFNKEMDELLAALKELAKTSVKAILFYDQAIMQLVKENDIKLDLVWNQTHMVTNYQTVNYYFDKGVKYAYLSAEITLEEMLEIKSKTKSTLMANLYGRAIMSFSRRHLLDNFYKSINKEKDQIRTVVKDKEKSYLVEDKQEGTVFMSDNFINGSVILDTDIDYGIIRKDGLDDRQFKKLLELTKNYLEGDKTVLDEVETLIGSDTGFYFKKTIFKVGKNAK